MADRLYETPEFDGADDYIGEVGLERIGQLVERLPAGFDVKATQASTKGVTVTLRFDGGADPFAHAETFTAMMHAVTVVRMLHANLVAARKALSGERGSDA